MRKHFLLHCRGPRGRFIVVARPRAQAPFATAIRGARIVTAAGAPIESGTIVMRGGIDRGGRRIRRGSV